MTPNLAIAQYYPNSENLQNGTVGITGSVTDLNSNDGNVRILRSFNNLYTADYQTTSSDEVSTYSTNTSYVDKASITWTVPTTDYYFVYATAEITRTSTNGARTTRAQLVIDGTSYAETFVGDDITTTLYRSFVGIEYAYLTAGSHTVKIQYATTNTANTATIRNARITIVRVGTMPVIDEVGTTTTSSATYVETGAAITINSDITQDWIVFAHSEILTSQFGIDMYANLMIGGTQYAETYLRIANTTNYVPATAIKKISLVKGTSTTMSIQFKANGNLTARNIKLYAIPTRLFSEVQMAESEAFSTCSTCTLAAPADKTVLTFTPASQGTYLIAAVGEIGATNATNYTTAILEIDGVASGASAEDVSLGACNPSFNIHSTQTLTAASHTIKIRYYNTTTGIVSRIRNARILAIRLPPTSQQKLEVEYSGAGDTMAWTQVTWDLFSSFSAASVGVSYQLYNYNSAAYPTTGDGFISYTSNAVGNTEEEQIQTISTNPTYYRDSGGNWKIKITASSNLTDWIDYKGDLLSVTPFASLISVTVNNGTINYGQRQWGEIVTASSVGQSQAVVNAGNVNEDFFISGTDTACPWTLSATQGNNQYYHKFLTTGYNSGFLGVGSTLLASNVSAGATIPVNFELGLPTSTSCINPQSVNMTITVSQH